MHCGDTFDIFIYAKNTVSQQLAHRDCLQLSGTLIVAIVLYVWQQSHLKQLTSVPM